MHIVTERELDRWERLKKVCNTGGVRDVQNTAKQGRETGQEG